MQWTESERAAWLTVQEHNLDALLDVSQARADMSWTRGHNSAWLRSLGACEKHGFLMDRQSTLEPTHLHLGQITS